MPHSPPGGHRTDPLGVFGRRLGSNRTLCGATIAARQNEFQFELEIHSRGHTRGGGARLRRLGLDLADAVHFGAEDNVLAVKVDNRTTYVERSSNTPFEWNTNDFNPDHGGINRHVWLHVTGKIYQTLPLYYGLESTGVYVHAANFDITGNSAGVTIESEVKNASGDHAKVELS